MNDDEENKETNISKSKTLKEIAGFWDTHSLDDYWDETKEVEFEIRAKRRRRGNAMAENIREFLLRFPEEELLERGVLQGSHKLLRAPSIDPLIALMKEHGVEKLELPNRDWFLDIEYNFYNPRSRQKATNISQLSNRGAVFTLQNRHLNPHYVGWYRRSSEELDESVDEYDIDEDLDTEESTITFGLERDLQRALRNNIGQLEPGLKIIDGDKERTVAAGRIDITAEDADGSLVVIELKAGPANPDSLTQILSYMAALEAEERKPVRGILVAGGFHDRVVWAARKVPDLRLKEYSFSFSFSDR